MFADAAKAAKVELLVWSGLESYTEISGGKYTHAVHFDVCVSVLFPSGAHLHIEADLCINSKAAITQYCKDTEIPFVNVEASGYYQNFLGAP